MRSRLRYGIVGDSGHRVPFLSVTREMSIRFFGYFAGKQTANERTKNERTNKRQRRQSSPTARDISWGASYASNCAPSNTFQISLSVLFPFCLFTGTTAADAPFDPSARTSPRISHITFRVSLSLRECLFRVSYSAFRCVAREIARVHARESPTTENLSNGTFTGTPRQERLPSPPCRGCFFIRGMNRPIRAAFSRICLPVPLAAAEAKGCGVGGRDITESRG